LPSLSTHSIIVVDDEPELATLFKAFLKNEGYEAVSFTDPVLALEYFKETAEKHSLIITDLRMPGICGIELAKSIREMNIKIRIFLMTRSLAQLAKKAIFLSNVCENVFLLLSYDVI
jgi:CheY-like chemotaxis protein